MTSKDVTLSAKMMGKLFDNKPYESHDTLPVICSKYILSERSRVCLVRIVLIACGKNADVVQAAAKSPSIVIGFM